jgi:SAM-dependent methyltransferase
MPTFYDEKYRQEGYYWGVRRSAMCLKVLELMPPERPLKLLDIGCGEGRNVVFFARNGYHVAAFDLSPVGVEKTKRLAAEAGVSLETFTADLLEFRLQENFDILFSTGTLHYIPPRLRAEIFDNYKQCTNPDGLHVFSVFVRKPFIPEPPDAEATAHAWFSGSSLRIITTGRSNSAPRRFSTATLAACRTSMPSIGSSPGRSPLDPTSRFRTLAGAAGRGARRPRFRQVCTGSRAGTAAHAPLKARRTGGPLLPEGKARA